MTTALAYLGQLAGDAIARAGLEGRSADDLSRAELERCAAIVLSLGSVGRLRGWRAAGVKAPAIVITPGADAIDDRVLLEPVAWAAPDQDLQDVLQRFATRRRAVALRLGQIRVDLERRTYSGARSGHLTELEAGVLGYLAARRGRVVPRDELLREVWGYQAFNTNTVAVLIGRVRKKLELGRTPVWLLTARGGYRLAHGDPAVLPDLVGRAEDLAVAAEHLRVRGTVRIGGPPGIGKSELARALTVPDALWLDVAGCRTLEAVVHRLAHAVQRRIDDDAVLNAVLDEQTMVILDGLDPVLATLDPLVGRCPVVITTRASDTDVVLGPLCTAGVERWLVSWASRRGVVLRAGDDVRLAAAVEGFPAALEVLATALSVMPADVVVPTVERWLLADDTLAQVVRARLATSTPAEESVLRVLAGFVGSFDRADAARWLGPRALVLGGLCASGAVEEDGERLRLNALLREHLRGLRTSAEQRAHVERLAPLCRQLVERLVTGDGHAALGHLARLGPDLEEAWVTGPRSFWIGRALAALAGHLGSWATRLQRAEEAVEAATGDDRAVGYAFLAEMLAGRDPARSVGLYDRAAELCSEPGRWRVEAARAVATTRDWPRVRERLAMARPLQDTVAKLLAGTLVAWVDHNQGRISEAQLIDHKLGSAPLLVAEGAVPEAVREVVQAVGALRLSDGPRALEELRTLRPSILGIVAPQARIQLAIAEAELLSDVEHDLDTALQRLDEADRIADRFAPHERGVIEGVRGTLLHDAGRTAEARASLRRNLAFERVRGSALSRLSVLLDLIGLELDTDTPEAAHVWIRDAEKLGLERYAHYIAFERGTAHALTGDLSAAMADFAVGRSAPINITCGASLGLRAIAVATLSQPGAVDAWRAWLDDLLRGASGRAVQDARELLAAFDAGTLPEGPSRNGLNAVDRRVLRLALEA